MEPRSSAQPFRSSRPVPPPALVRRRAATLPDGAQLLRRIAFDFVYMPEMRLTAAQGARLWAVDLDSCRDLLDGLVSLGFLERIGEQAYARTRR